MQYFLPNSERDALRICIGAILAGIASAILFILYGIQKSPMNGRWFIVYTVIYGLILLICSLQTKIVKKNLHKTLKYDGSLSDYKSLLSLLESSEDAINRLKYKYWVWHLFGGYLQGAFFPWIAMVIYFQIRG